MTYNSRVSAECIKGRKVRMTDLGQLALEDIDLVEEMGHSCVQKPLGADNALEQDQRLHHRILMHET